MNALPKVAPQPAPRLARMTRVRATRSWIVQGCAALVFATEGNELFRVELDAETANLLREKVPQGIWPAAV